MGKTTAGARFNLPPIARDESRGTVRGSAPADSRRVGAGESGTDANSCSFKITRFSRKGRMQTIKLEGQILEPWVGTVRDACTKRGRRSTRLRLDLAAVTFADAAGVQLLRALMRAGIEIATCSSFLGELLHLEDS